MKRYLITGGGGFIGAAITKKLIQERNYVRILDNKSRGIISPFPKSDLLDFVKVDIRNPKEVIKACKKIDSVIHLAYINGTEFFYSKPELVLEVGVKGIVNILDACLHENISEFFLASSSEVYQTPQIIPTPENVSLIIPDPYNPRYSYGGGKILSELMTIHYGKKFFKRAIIFRPHNVYGPNMGWEHVIPQLALKIKNLAKRKQANILVPIQGTGNETRAFIYIDDFVNCLATVIKKGKHLETYNIGSKNETKIKDIAQLIGSYYKKDVIVKPSKLSKGSTQRRCPDVSKIAKLGFIPKVSLRKGLQNTLDWYDQNLK